jgi:hypothetical protein
MFECLETDLKIDQNFFVLDLNFDYFEPCQYCSNVLLRFTPHPENIQNGGIARASHNRTGYIGAW